MEFGVQGKCLFNVLPSFHVIFNKIMDLMHDLQLGVIKFILFCALNYFILTYEDFDLITFNTRLKNFDYGSKERTNKPSPIADSHLKYGLHMNANETLFTLRYFPLLVKNMIPYDDLVYQFILDSIDIVNLCFAPQFDITSLAQLRQRISSNRRHYLFLFDQHLRPKDHHMLHYDISIVENGPLKYTSAIRPESKHQVIRAYTNNSRNRRNICYSISKKLGYGFASFLINNTGKKLLSSISKYSLQLTEEVEDTTIEFINQFNYTGTFIQGKIKLLIC